MTSFSIFQRNLSLCSPFRCRLEQQSDCEHSALCESVPKKPSPPLASAPPFIGPSARWNLMLTQPTQRPLVGRDFSPNPPEPNYTLHLLQSGERFGYELEKCTSSKTFDADLQLGNVLIVLFLLLDGWCIVNSRVHAKHK